MHALDRIRTALKALAVLAQIVSPYAGGKPPQPHVDLGKYIKFRLRGVQRLKNFAYRPGKDQEHV